MGDSGCWRQRIYCVCIFYPRGVQYCHILETPPNHKIEFLVDALGQSTSHGRVVLVGWRFISASHTHHAPLLTPVNGQCIILDAQKTLPVLSCVYSSEITWKTARSWLYTAVLRMLTHLPQVLLIRVIDSWSSNFFNCSRTSKQNDFTHWSMAK